MNLQKLLLVSLLAGLYGCQPENATQQQTAPVEAMPAASEPVSAAPAQAPVAQSASAVQPAPSAAVGVVAPAAAKVVAPVKASPAKVEAPAAKVIVPIKEQVVATPTVPAVAASVAAVPPAAKPVISEADALALAKKNNCLACHAIDHKVVGPAWKDVAVKYRGDATAEAHLINKIAVGGSGVWGSMAMPAHPKLSEAERTTLARFVLNLK